MTNRLIGYAAMFNVKTAIGGVVEQCAPGCFAQTLKDNTDVRALLNHDPNVVLGRTSNGTLSLREDSRGLRFEIRPPTEVGYVADVVAAVRAGLFSECSFAFQVLPGGERWVTGDPPERTLTNLQLFDISIVTYPAYSATMVEANSARAVWMNSSTVRAAGRIMLNGAELTERN